MTKWFTEFRESAHCYDSRRAGPAYGSLTRDWSFLMDFRQNGKAAILTPETFRFFSELTTNNSKSWMDMNRDRYQQHVVGPLRDLLEALTPEVLKLEGGF